MVVLALAMSAFVLNLNSNVMGALLPFLRGEFGFDGAGGAMLLAAAGAGSALGALVVADAGRWFGRRVVLGASLSIFVLASAALTRRRTSIGGTAYGTNDGVVGGYPHAGGVM